MSNLLVKKKKKTRSEIVLLIDLSNLYIKKYSNLLQPVRVTIFLYATKVSLLKLIFYIKEKKEVDLKLQNRISRKKSLREYLENAVRKHLNVTIFVRYYLSSFPEVYSCISKNRLVLPVASLLCFAELTLSQYLSVSTEMQCLTDLAMRSTQPTY